MAKGLNFSGDKVVLIFVFLIGILVLFGSFFSINEGEISFNQGADVSNVVVAIFTIMILGIGVILAFKLLPFLSDGGLTQRKLIALIVIAIAVWFLWDNLLADIFNMDSLSGISFSVAQKLGFAG